MNAVRENHLICRIMDRVIYIKADSVQQILEYESVPKPPMVEPWVVGFSIYDEIPFTILAPEIQDAPTQELNGRKLLLIKAAQGGARWAFRIDAVSGMSSSELHLSEPHHASDWISPSGWFCRAQKADGATGFWLDTRAVSACLA